MEVSRRIPKGRGSCEPVGRSEVKPNCKRNSLGSQAAATPDDAQQTESCDELAEKLAAVNTAAGAQIEHDLSRLQFSQRRWVATAKRSSKGRVRDFIFLRPVVEV